MKNKKQIIFLISLISFTTMMAQNSFIVTAAPYLKFGSDARSGGIADIGVSSSSDYHSQRWNPAKYLFHSKESGIGISYSPYLADITGDIFTGNVSYFKKLSDRSALSFGLVYFNIGEVEKTGALGQNLGVFYPLELAVDGAYSLKLGDKYGMSVAMRFIMSDRNDNTSTNNKGNSFAVDIAGYYESDEHRLSNISGKLRLGYNISNIGPKIKYNDNASDGGSNLPTNLAVGASYDFIFSGESRLSVLTQFNKLLVPSNQIGEDGLYYTPTDKGVLAGMFSSFGDAPGGLTEELQEISIAIGTEFWFSEMFAIRGGYYNENENKGSRRFVSLGTSIQYEGVGMDFAYLFGMNRANSAGDNGFKVSLTYNFF